MADTTLFGRLRRLFSTNVVVRNVGGKKLRVSDTSRTQSVAHNNLIDRYQKLFTNSGLSGYSDSLLTKTMRLNLFKDYENIIKFQATGKRGRDKVEIVAQNDHDTPGEVRGENSRP